MRLKNSLLWKQGENLLLKFSLLFRSFSLHIRLSLLKIRLLLYDLRKNRGEIGRGSPHLHVLDIWHVDLGCWRGSAIRHLPWKSSKAPRIVLTSVTNSSGLWKQKRKQNFEFLVLLLVMPEWLVSKKLLKNEISFCFLKEKIGLTP